jgi:hypothetical protein
MERILTSIQLTRETRSLLTKIGRKEQTYDELIRELINLKQNSNSLENQHSREFVN